jgi:large subunit ribosomal protein L30
MATEEKLIEITLTRSLIGRVPTHRKTAIALGLSRPGKKVIKRDTPAIRGMIKQLDFMVKVREVE